MFARHRNIKIIFSEKAEKKLPPTGISLITYSLLQAGSELLLIDEYICASPVMVMKSPRRY